MGQSYSQPPRGYLYSQINYKRGEKGKNIIERQNPDYESDLIQFNNFQSLFLNNFEYEQNIVCFQEFNGSRNVSYGQVYEILQAGYSNLQASYKQGTTAGVYAHSTNETFLIFCLLLLAGIPIFPVTPSREGSDFKNFIKGCEENNVSLIFCDPCEEKRLSSSLPTCSIYPIVSKYFQSSTKSSFPEVDSNSPAFIYCSHNNVELR